MLAAWRKVTKAVDPWLDALTADDLATDLAGPGPQRTAGDSIHRVIYHYWFHIGEILAIRQILGHTKLPEFVGDIEAKAPYRSAPLSLQHHHEMPEFLLDLLGAAHRLGQLLKEQFAIADPQTPDKRFRRRLGDREPPGRLREGRPPLSLDQKHHHPPQPPRHVPQDAQPSPGKPLQRAHG